MNDYKFMPSYQLELANDSPENLKKLKEEGIDIFVDISENK